VTNLLSIQKLIFIFGLCFSLWSPVVSGSIEDFMTDENSQFEVESTQKQITVFKKSNAGKAHQYKSQNPREIPTTYHDAIIDHDVPIEMIQDFNELSFNHWNNKIFTEDEKGFQKSYNLDPNTLKDLNTRSYRFWNRLVACNQNSANKARVHFMMLIDGIGLCENGNGEIDEVKSNELLVDLKNIYTNFQSFYTDINLNLTDSLKNSDSYSLFYSLFQNLHPVLVQILVLQTSVYTYSEYEELNSKVSLSVHHLNSTIMSYNSKYDRSFEKPDEINTKKIVLGWILNSSAILSLINYKNFEYQCGVYGLWPILNTTLLAQYAVIVKRETMMNSVAKACGNKDNIAYATIGSSFFYTSTWLFHRNFMQVLNYKLSSWDNRSDGQKKMDAITNTAEQATESALDIGCSIPLINAPFNIIDKFHNLFDPWGMGGGYLCH
jgi:hypothetical protein